MRAACLAAFLSLLTTDCSSVKQTPSAEPAQSAVPGTGAVTVAPTPPVSGPQSSLPPSAVAAQSDQSPEARSERPSVASTAAPAGKGSPKGEAPVAKAPAKATTAPAAAPPTPQKDATQEPAKKTEPPLDLASLENRLKETKAIGVMTKLALKNQVDDLLNQFRAFYAGKLKTTLAELRRPFDLLILKVLSLLQDSDPSLAAAIVASREAIWGILSDPVKFANFAST